MRPRFIIHVSCGADEVMSALREGASRAENEVETSFSERHGVIRIPKQRRRFWSPQLGLTIEAGSQPGGAEVLGIFTPQPEIWTGFVFAIGTLITIGVFGMMYGIVQLSLGWPAWAFLTPVIATVLGALVYTATLVGQGLGAGEMYRLRSFLDRCLENAQKGGRPKPRTAPDSAQL